MATILRSKIHHYALFLVVYGYTSDVRRPLEMVMSLHYITTISLNDIIDNDVVLAMFVYNPAEKHSLVTV